MGASKVGYGFGYRGANRPFLVIELGQHCHHTWKPSEIQTNSQDEFQGYVIDFFKNSNYSGVKKSHIYFKQRFECTKSFQKYMKRKLTEACHTVQKVHKLQHPRQLHVEKLWYRVPPSSFSSHIYVMFSFQFKCLLDYKLLL